MPPPPLSPPPPLPPCWAAVCLLHYIPKADASVEPHSVSVMVGIEPQPQDKDFLSGRHLLNPSHENELKLWWLERSQTVGGSRGSVR